MKPPAEPEIAVPDGLLTAPVAAPAGGLQVLPRSLRRGPARHPAGHGHGHRQDLVACMLLLASAPGAALDRRCPLRVVPVWLTQFERHVGIAVDHRRARRGRRPRREEDGAGRGEDAARRGARRAVRRGDQLRLRVARPVRVVGREAVGGIWSSRTRRIGSRRRAARRHVLQAAAAHAALPRSRSPARRCRTARWIFTRMFRFLDITIFGPSFAAFRQKYAVMGGYQRKQITGYQNLDELEALMSRITFRVGNRGPGPAARDGRHLSLRSGRRGRAAFTGISRRTSWRT